MQEHPDMRLMVAALNRNAVEKFADNVAKLTPEKIKEVWKECSQVSSEQKNWNQALMMVWEDRLGHNVWGITRRLHNIAVLAVGETLKEEEKINFALSCQQAAAAIALSPLIGKENALLMGEGWAKLVSKALE